MGFGIDDHPIYKPLLNRVVIVGIAAAWAAFEVFYSQQGLWIVISVSILAYCIWKLFIQPPKSDPPKT